MGLKYFKKVVKLVVFISIIFPVKLTATDFQKIIQHVNNTPNSTITSTKRLSTYLTSTFKTDKEKFAAIYYWVAKNITYNHSLAAKPIYYENVDEIINHVMKEKNGVCQHYSELFARLSKLAGLTAYVVVGYTSSDQVIDKLSHAWNIIKVDGKWYFTDATWAGSATKTIAEDEFPEQFFMISPEESIKRRMPFDPIWQALSHPLKYHEFDKGVESQLRKGNFNFNDSIYKHFHLKQEEQYLAIVRRMKSNGTFNQLVKKEYELMQSNYKMLLYNQEVEKYNKASTFYNKGMQFYNNYARLKNNRTLYLSKSKGELIGIIDSCLTNLDKAQKLFETINGNTEMKPHLEKNEKIIRKISTLMKEERSLVSKKS